VVAREVWSSRDNIYFCGKLRNIVHVWLDEIFSSTNFFKLFEQFQKLVAFLIPIFGNVDRVVACHSKLRGSTLIQVARRRSKVFQRFAASLVRVGDVQSVPR